MNKESIKYVMRQFVDRPLPVVFRRELDVPVDSGKVITLVGSRRTGKTFLMFQIMKDLFASGIEKEQVVYLNFEDDRLYPVESSDLDLILTAHSELFPEASRKKRYLFFDEVQNICGWERYIRRINDTENVSVFLTGSSSSLLQKDMSTAMRGRSVTYEVYPLSFAEFLSFRKVEYVPYSRQSEATVIHAFHEYLDWGGFPEVVLAEDALRLKILQEYASIMFHRDLIERYSIRNERVMRLLFKFCAEHTGSLLSVNKLFNDFRSQGLKLGKATLYEYIDMLQDSFLVFSSTKYDPSARRELQSPQKIHLIDSGIGKVFSTSSEKNIGHRFETLIYLHERRRRRDISYYRNGFELDMCWDGGSCFVNVAWDLSDDRTCEREVKAMSAGLSMWSDASACLVYGVGNAPEVPDGIQLYEGWRYLLGEYEN